MTTETLPAVSQLRRTDRTWRLTCTAGMLQLSALTVVLANGSAAVIAVVLAGAGVVVAAAALGPRLLASVLGNRGWIVFGLVVAGAALWTAGTLARVGGAGLPYQYWTNYGPYGPPLSGPLAPPSLIGPVPLLGVIVLAAASGLVLIADAVRIWLGLAPHQRAPWRELTATPQRAGGIAWRGLLGVVLIGWAASVGIGLAHQVGGVAPFGVALAAMCVIGTPIVVGSLMRVDHDKVGSARERERQRFAAHLHDSVLQTLALVQRQSHDPAVVVRLARRQEHALRAWMAGESELLSETLVAGLRDAVATVEDEHDLTIELTAIGDRPLDPAGEALVAAAREALRNAATHAAGARVLVFADISPSAVEVFVRDEGPGFDPATVPPERRGIRDAIVGRMASAGGTADVESAPGEGTEIALRLERGRAGR